MSKRKAEEPESAEDAAKRQKCEAKAAITAAKLVSKAIVAALKKAEAKATSPESKAKAAAAKAKLVFETIDKVMDEQSSKMLEANKKVIAYVRRLDKASHDQFEAFKASKPSAAALAAAQAAHDLREKSELDLSESAFEALENTRQEFRAVWKALGPMWTRAANEVAAAEHALLELTQVLSLRGVMLSAAHTLYAVRVEKATDLVREVVYDTSAKILMKHANERGPYAWYIVATDEKRFALKFHLIPEPNEMKFKLHRSGGSTVPDPRLFHVSLNVPGGVWTIPQAYAMLTAPTAKPLQRLEKGITIDDFTVYVMDQVMENQSVMWHVDSPGVVLPFDDDNDAHTDVNGEPAPGGNALSKQLETARSSAALVICP